MKCWILSPHCCSMAEAFQPKLTWKTLERRHPQQQYQNHHHHRQYNPDYYESKIVLHRLCCSKDDQEEKLHSFTGDSNERWQVLFSKQQRQTSLQGSLMMRNNQQDVKWNGKEDIRNNNSKNTSTTTTTNYLDDLTPPPVNFARNSILFSDNPSTKYRNNIALDTWRTCRTYLPGILTGAWPWRDVQRLDDQPLAALYNMIMVRLPVVVVGIFYWKQLIWDHHDLVMDFGFVITTTTQQQQQGGSQVMNPWLVTAIFGLILL